MEKNTKKITHNSTLKVLAIFELMASGKRYALSEIAKKISAATSTIFPIVHTLKDNGYLNYDEKTQEYSLGVRIFEIGSQMQNTNSYDELVGILNGIVEACGETAHFGILDEGDVLYIAKVDSKEAIRMISRIGSRLPAYSTAIGKALLKNYSVLKLQQMYPDGLKPLTENTITDFKVLYQQLNKNKEFTYEKEESNEYIQCIGRPVYKNNEIYGALSVSIPTFRYNNEKAQIVKKSLMEAAIFLERILPNIKF